MESCGVACLLQTQRKQVGGKGVGVCKSKTREKWWKTRRLIDGLWICGTGEGATQARCVVGEGQKIAPVVLPGLGMNLYTILTVR